MSFLSFFLSKKKRENPGTMGLRMFGRDPPRLGKREKKTGKTFLFFFFVVWHLKNEIIISRRLVFHGCTRSMGQVRLHLPSDSGRQTNSPPPLLLLLILFVPFIPMTYIERREVRGCWVNFCPNEWGRCQLVSVCQPPSTVLV